jgi:hypothetical protein
MSSWYRMYGDSLRVGRSGYLISVGVRFSLPVLTCPATHLVSCTMDTVSLPGVKPPERGADHPPRSSLEVGKGLELYIRSLFDPHGPVMERASPLYLGRWVLMFSKGVLSPSSGNSEGSSVKLQVIEHRCWNYRIYTKSHEMRKFWWIRISSAPSC